MKTDLSNYPKSYLLCFLDKCEKKEQCAHFIAQQHSRDEQLMGKAVCHAALSQQGGCPFYHPLTEIRAAWGFKRLFKNVLSRHDSSIRAAVKDYLGSNGTYYRYMHGVMLLTPEQQKHILEIFHDYGYSGELKFDGYKDVLNW